MQRDRRAPPVVERGVAIAHLVDRRAAALPELPIATLEDTHAEQIPLTVRRRARPLRRRNDLDHVDVPDVQRVGEGGRAAQMRPEVARDLPWPSTALRAVSPTQRGMLLAASDRMEAGEHAVLQCGVWRRVQNAVCTVVIQGA